MMLSSLASSRLQANGLKAFGKSTPRLLTVAQYCQIRNCSQASAYNEFKRHFGLAIKDRRSTRVVRDVAFELLAGLPPWVPENERACEKDKPYQRSQRLAPAVSETVKL